MPLTFPEGPYIYIYICKLLGNWAPKYHTIEGIMGPNSLLVVHVDPLRFTPQLDSAQGSESDQRFEAQKGLGNFVY